MARATSATGTAICPIWARPKFACGELDMRDPPVISWSGDVQHEIGFEAHGGCVLEMEDTPGGRHHRLGRGMDEQRAHHQYAAPWNSALVGTVAGDEVLDGSVGEDSPLVR